MGAPLWCWALIYGLLSALSLPIGAVLGITMSPISPRTSARWMAFGSGALVFAVATQLYGEVLARLALVMEHDKLCEQRICFNRFENIFIQTFTGLVGSILYVLLNKMLARAFGGAPSHPQSRDPSRSSEEPSDIELQQVSQLQLQMQMPEPLVGESFRGTMIHCHQSTPNVALSMWLGLLLDGIPEALMLGFMTNDGRITYVFLGAIFIANFPEAFSGASILVGHGMRKRAILFMWTAVFLLTGVLAMVGSLIVPAQVSEGSWIDYIRSASTAGLEGLTGGAMLAMVSTAMLPEAFKETGEIAGIFFVLGFVISVLIDGLGTRFAGA